MCVCVCVWVRVLMCVVCACRWVLRVVMDGREGGCERVRETESKRERERLRRLIVCKCLNTQQPIQGIGTHAHWSGRGLAN